MADDPAASERKRICIIGGGANGLATLKILADTPQVKDGRWSLVAFEERHDIGGIWLPAPPTDDPPFSPLYDSLETNIPHPLMAFTTFSFPPGIALYPSADVVLKYLNDYTDHFDLRKYVHLNTRVDRAIWDAPAHHWQVTLSTNPTPLIFDYLVVANGHFREPRLPDTPGAQAWLASGRAIHAAHFRRASDYAQHKRVLVVGGGPSALDISTELRAAGRTVLHSQPPASHPDFPGPPPAPGYTPKPLVTAYRADGTAAFADGSTEHIDFAIFATGYQYTFPFLPQLARALPPPPPPLPARLTNSTYHVTPLALHLFPLTQDIPPTAAAFPGLLVRVAPFPLFEDQARAIAHLLAHPAALDPAAEGAALVARARALGADDALRLAKAWFYAAPHEPFEYRAALRAFAGDPWAAQEWEVALWDRKVALRRAWRALIACGLGVEWVRGVGEGGVQDWVELCWRVLEWGEGREAEETV